jgi:probable phosphomutase (TIGR03848 family)
MSLVVLVRHAHSSANARGVLSGRKPDVHLSPTGRKQALNLASRLGAVSVKTLRVSPLERCQETIAPWLKKYGGATELETDDGLIEMDYGTWSGRKLRSLAKDPLWEKVQMQPSRVCFPQGESIAGMQARAMSAIFRALESPGKGHVLVVSHGDILKTIIASSLGMHVDEFQRFVVDPASISVLDFSQSKPRLLLMNDSRSRVAEVLITDHSKRKLVGGGSGIDARKKGSK